MKTLVKLEGIFTIIAYCLQMFHKPFELRGDNKNMA